MTDRLEPTRKLAVHPSPLSREQRRVLDACYEEAAKSGFMERYTQALGNLAARHAASLKFVHEATGQGPSEADEQLTGELQRAIRAEADVAFRFTNIKSLQKVWQIEAIELMRAEAANGQEITMELPGSRVTVSAMGADEFPVDKARAPFIANDSYLAIACSGMIRHAGIHLDEEYADQYSLWLASDDSEA